MANTKNAGVSMADASALNGGTPEPSEAPAVAAPDASTVTFKATDGGDLPFVSEGMRHDLVSLGHATDPNTGRKVEIA